MFEVGDRVVLQVYTPRPYPTVETWPASIVTVKTDTVLVQYWDETVDEYGDEHDILRTLEVRTDDRNVKLLKG